ncbi:MAG: cation:proton antiporter domain-containing protein, partial [Planctomycetota bacterium]
ANYSEFGLIVGTVGVAAGWISFEWLIVVAVALSITFVLIPAFLVARPILMAILSRCGHGELLILMGVLLTMAGDASFEAVHLKGDLGALAVGALIAAHPKAPELAKALLSFKDLFLVGFFLNIGLQGPPSVEVLVIAGLLVLAVPFKVALFLPTTASSASSWARSASPPAGSALSG